MARRKRAKAERVLEVLRWITDGVSPWALRGSRLNDNGAEFEGIGIGGRDGRDRSTDRFPAWRRPRRLRSYETLRTPLDLRNAIVRAALRDAGIDPDRLAEMTPVQQAHILAQVQELGRHTGEMRTAAERRLAEDWRRFQEERREPSANETPPLGPFAVVTDIARALLGADFSGASAAFLQYAHTHYTETYAPFSGASFRTTAERAGIYRGLEEAYASAPPQDRARVGRIVQGAERFFQRADEDERSGRPLSPGTVRLGIEAGNAGLSEAERHHRQLDELIRLMGTGMSEADARRQLGISPHQFRQAIEIHTLLAEIQRRLPGASPEAAAAITRALAEMRALEEQFHQAGNNPTRRLEILRQFRDVLGRANVASAAEITRIDGLIARTEGWEQFNQAGTQIRTRLDEMRRSRGSLGQTELDDLVRFHGQLRGRIAWLEAPRPGSTPGQEATWRAEALQRERQSLERVVALLGRAGQLHLIGMAPPPTPTPTPPSPSGPQAEAPSPSRPAATAPAHTPSASDPLP